MYNYLKWIQKLWFSFLLINNLLFVVIRNRIFFDNPKTPYLPVKPKVTITQMVQETQIFQSQKFKITRIDAHYFRFQQLDDTGKVLWQHYLSPIYLKAMLKQLNDELMLENLFKNESFRVSDVEFSLSMPQTRWGVPHLVNQLVLESRVSFNRMTRVAFEA